jgi:hypothetical protein
MTIATTTGIKIGTHIKVYNQNARVSKVGCKNVNGVEKTFYTIHPPVVYLSEIFHEVDSDHVDEIIPEFVSE